MCSFPPSACSAFASLLTSALPSPPALSGKPLGMFPTSSLDKPKALASFAVHPFAFFSLAHKRLRYTAPRPEHIPVRNLHLNSFSQLAFRWFLPSSVASLSPSAPIFAFSAQVAPRGTKDSPGEAKKGRVKAFPSPRD